MVTPGLVKTDHLNTQNKNSGLNMQSSKRYEQGLYKNIIRIPQNADDSKQRVVD